jgi:hypothetical protein
MRRLGEVSHDKKKARKLGHRPIRLTRKIGLSAKFQRTRDGRYYVLACVNFKIRKELLRTPASVRCAQSVGSSPTQALGSALAKLSNSLLSKSR